MEVTGSTIPTSLLVTSPGGMNATTKPYSHFHEPIPDDGKIHGNTRRWGDIDLLSQQEVVGEILRESARQNLDSQSIAFVLATARVESGFNPDAAAQSTSASGIGQFIDATGRAYGLDDSNRFDLRANVRAFVSHVKDNMRAVRAKYEGLTTTEFFAQVYARYHDGPSLKYGGLSIAKEKVLPWMRHFSQWLSTRR